MKREDLPNAVSILRIFLVFPLLYALTCKAYVVAFWIFIIAGLTDAIDGFLARRYRWMSRFGAMIDPLADKFLLVIGFISLGFLGQMPLWLVAAVVLRDIIIVVGGVAYHFYIGKYEFKPTWISKVNTFLQIVLLTIVLFHLAYTVIAEKWLEYLIYMVGFTSIYSLIDYIIVWGLKAFEAKRKLPSKEQ